MKSHMGYASPYLSMTLTNCKGQLGWRNGVSKYWGLRVFFSSAYMQQNAVHFTSSLFLIPELYIAGKSAKQHDQCSACDHHHWPGAFAAQSISAGTHTFPWTADNEGTQGVLERRLFDVGDHDGRSSRRRADDVVLWCSDRRCTFVLGRRPTVPHGKVKRVLCARMLGPAKMGAVSSRASNSTALTAHRCASFDTKIGKLVDQIWGICVPEMKRSPRAK